MSAEPGRETGYRGDSQVCFQIGKHMFRPVSVSVEVPNVNFQSY